MRPITRSGLVFVSVASCLAFWLADRLAALFGAADGLWVERLSAALSGLAAALAARPFYLSTAQPALLTGLAAAVLVWLVWLYWLTAAKNYMFGAEHGTARWGGPKDIRPLINPEPDLNIPLSATERISLPELPDFEHNRNKNILLVGAPGSGKTYGAYYPSMLQLHSSYVITDPKGTMLEATGHLFRKHGYRIKVFNTVDFARSMHYNPLAYIRTEADILKVVNVLIENTRGEGDRSGEDFWVKAERMMYTALIAYLWEEAPASQQTIPMVAHLLELCQVREDDEEYVNPVDVLFERLERKKPRCLAVRQYAKFKLAAGKTAKSILVSCGARLSPFDIGELEEITAWDELELDQIGSRKTAFFVVMSDTDPSYSFLVAMMMYQLFNLLCTRADTEYGGKLPLPVRCLLDEFYNIGKIPGFQHLISTIRSRSISCMLGLQSLAQLQAVYKDDADGIVDSCDTILFLGGKSSKTARQLSELIGKATVDTKNASEHKGQYGNYGLQNNTLARDLIDPSEIGRLGRSECLVLISGLPPFRSQKLDPAKHPRYGELSVGGSPKFDPAEALTAERTPPAPDTYTTVEAVSIDLSELNDLKREGE